jgi:hypothetical protein
MVLFHMGVKIHELGGFMFVSDGNPILGSKVLAYKAWAQCPSVISHGYLVKTELSPEGIYLSYCQNICISHRGYCNLCS